MKKFIAALILIAGYTACTEGRKDGEETNQASAKAFRKPANEMEENIYRAADSMLAAFKSKDWATFVSFNHSTMVQMKGGQEAFVKSLSSQMQQVPDSIVKDITAGKILQVVKTPDDYQCVIEHNTIMEMDATRIISTTYLVGESSNGGKTWTFFDAANGGAVKPTDIKPNLSPELKVPVKKQDVKQV